MAKKAKATAKKVWVSDPNDLLKVEKTRKSVQSKDKKGSITGGTEYFGLKK